MVVIYVCCALAFLVLIGIEGLRAYNRRSPKSNTPKAHAVDGGLFIPANGTHYDIYPVVDVN